MVNPSKLPSTHRYYFYRGLAEYSLSMKKEAIKSLGGLEIFSDELVPERYTYLAAIMNGEMKEWKEDDLGHVARKMQQVSQRLKNGKSGKVTQKLQKDIVASLDQMIKQEDDDQKNKDKNNEDKNKQDKDKPSSKDINVSEIQKIIQSDTNQPDKPMDDSKIANNGGKGIVDNQRLKNLGQAWGKLPQKDRAKAMQEIAKNMPAKYRETIEKYFKAISRNPEKRD